MQHLRGDLGVQLMKKKPMKNLRDLMQLLPLDGKVRHAFRQFNLAPKVRNRAQSVKELAERLGFSVVRRRLPNGMAGRLVQDPFSENGYSIEVNENHSVQSQRWTVLHEIGHYFLHADHSDPLAFDAHLDRSGYAFYVEIDEEREANEFASVLLFGDGALAAARSLYGDDVVRLAKYFGVSEKVIQIAMK